VDKGFKCLLDIYFLIAFAMSYLVVLIISLFTQGRIQLSSDYVLEICRLCILFPFFGWEGSSKHFYVPVVKRGWGGGSKHFIFLW